MAVEKLVKITITPTEMAYLFWEMNHIEQAKFFNRLRDAVSKDLSEEERLKWKWRNKFVQQISRVQECVRKDGLICMK